MFHKRCSVCQKDFTAKCNRKTCSKACMKVAMDQTRPRPIMNCAQCKAQFQPPKTKQGAAIVRSGRGYCSEECKKKYTRKVSSETMSRTNRKYASARMRSKNPMSKPEIRKKVSSRLREMGWKPPVQGGNGRGMTAHEQLIADRLGWSPIVIPTKERSPYPTNYKVDVGNHKLKIAIEIDGHSHDSIRQRARDAKKQAFLESRGWTVFRFTNAQVETNLNECVRVVLSSILKSRSTTTTLQKAS